MWVYATGRKRFWVSEWNVGKQGFVASNVCNGANLVGEQKVLKTYKKFMQKQKAGRSNSSLTKNLKCQLDSL
jgi:hypothetical protein